MKVKKKIVKDAPDKKKKSTQTSSKGKQKTNTRSAETGNKKSKAKADSASRKKSSTSKKQKTKKDDEARFNESADYFNTGDSSTDDNSAEYEGLLGGMANKATKIIEQAASILEEEIAAGIVAARNVEEKYVNVSNLREEDKEQVMQRFRKDAHDVVDILLDLVNVSVNSFGGLARRVVTVRSSPSEKSNKDNNDGKNSGVPILAIPGVLKQNERGEVSMSVENDSNKSTEEFTFKCTGLLSDGEHIISTENIRVSPENIVVGPNTFEKVVISVKVPEGTDPGVYSGLLQATKLTHVRAMLTVIVE